MITGTIDSLKSQKKDVEQMRKDTECGISFESWDEFKVGDRIQCYEEKFEKRSL
jgi:translation initiation factor IF-2